MDFLTASLKSLKAYCQLNGITPEGNKTLTVTWRDAAIEFFTSEQAISAASTAIAGVAVTVEVAKSVVVKTFEVAKTTAVKAFEIATSERAIALYRKTIYIVAMLAVMLVCTGLAIGRSIIQSQRIRDAVGALRGGLLDVGLHVRSECAAWWQWLEREIQSILQNQSTTENKNET